MHLKPIYTTSTEVRRLEWDSNFFNLKIGRIDIEKFIQSKKIELKLTNDDKYDLIYLFINGNNCVEEAVIEEYKGSLVDEKCTFQLDNLERNELPDFIENYSKNEVATDLIDLALVAGQHSRYKLDPNFPKGTFENFYTTWIENSIMKNYADKIIISKHEGRISGFCSLKHSGNFSNISLIAVSPTYQGKGIGKWLIQGAINACIEVGIKSLRVATQKNNIQAVAFYSKLGFQLFKEEQVYHFWLKNLKDEYSI